MKKNRIKRWGIVSLFSVLGLELLLDNLFVINANVNPCVIFDPLSLNAIMLFICLLGLLLSIFFNRTYIGWQKIKDGLKTLIKNSVSGNTLDILFILFFLLHLTWIPDSIFDFVKKEPEGVPILFRVFHPFIYIMGLIGVIFLKPYKKEEIKEPLVVLSGISFISSYNIEPFLEPLRKHPNIERLYVFVDKRIKVFRLAGLENKKTYIYLEALHLVSETERLVTELREKLYEMEEQSKFEQGEIISYRLQLADIERSILASSNIRTIENVLNVFVSIVEKLDKDIGTFEIYRKFKEDKKLTEFCDDIRNNKRSFELLRNDLEVDRKKTNIDFFPYNDSLRLWLIKQYIKEITSEILTNIIEIRLIECDYDEIHQSYSKISGLVKELTSDKYKDENLLFNITPGTVNISVALALNSIKGNRICAYKEQNGKINENDGNTNKEFREINLDIYDLKDIFSELMD
jgi:hypothetical protein